MPAAAGVKLEFHAVVDVAHRLARNPFKDRSCDGVGIIPPLQVDGEILLRIAVVIDGVNCGNPAVVAAVTGTDVALLKAGRPPGGRHTGVQIVGRQHGLEAVAQGHIVGTGSQIHLLTLRTGDGADQCFGRLFGQVAPQLSREVLTVPQDADRAVLHVHDIVGRAVTDILLRVPLPCRSKGDRRALQVVADNLHGVSLARAVLPVRRNQGVLHLLGHLCALGQDAEALRLPGNPVGRHGSCDAVGVQRGMKAGIGSGHCRIAHRCGPGEPELLPAPLGEEAQHVNAGGLADQQAAGRRHSRHSGDTGGKPAFPGSVSPREHL